MKGEEQYFSIYSSVHLCGSNRSVNTNLHRSTTLAICKCVCVSRFLTIVLKLSCFGRMLLQDRQSVWQSLCPGSHRQSSSRATRVFIVPLSAAQHGTHKTYVQHYNAIQSSIQIEYRHDWYSIV